jgi:ABC-type transport system involved in multi-copper enzyme maturation permease subunit
MLHSPIMNVELLTVGRRRRYFVIRVVYGLLMLLAMWVCYESTIPRFSVTPLQGAAMFAATFFGTFAAIQLAAVLFLTPPMIAGTIASEHERRTIDYLLTTQLGDTEIALGKFAARMWAVFSQILTGLPILAVAMSMGGISPRQLFESFAVTLLTLLSVGSLSIVVSSRNTKAREAVTRTFVIVIGAMLVPALAMSIFFYFETESRGTWIGPFFTWLREVAGFGVMLNPFVFLFTTILRASSLAPFGMPVFAAFHAGVAVLFCWRAVWNVRRFYVHLQGTASRPIDPPRTALAPTTAAQVGRGAAGSGMAGGAGSSLPVVLEWEGTSAGGAAGLGSAGANSAEPISVEPAVALAETEQSARQVAETKPAVPVSRGPYVRRRDLLDADKPMWWKERIAQRTLGRLGWGARIATVLLYGAAWFWLGAAVLYSIDWKLSHMNRMESPIMFFAASGAPTFACIAMLLTAGRAAGSITSEREQDTWLSLISTPLDAGEIVRAKMLGAAFSVRYWYLLVVTAWFFCMLLHPTLLWVLPIMAFVYALGLGFAATIGVFFSLRSGTSLKAMGSALAVLVLGAGLGPLILAMLVQSEEPTAFSLPVVIGTPHFAAMALSRDYGPGASFTGYLVLVVIAAIGYVFATLGLYGACIHRFDEFVGRTSLRGGRARPRDEAPLGMPGAAEGRRGGEAEGP